MSQSAAMLSVPKKVWFQTKALLAASLSFLKRSLINKTNTIGASTHLILLFKVYESIQGWWHFTSASYFEVNKSHSSIFELNPVESNIGIQVNSQVFRLQIDFPFQHHEFPVCWAPETYMVRITLPQSKHLCLDCLVLGVNWWSPMWERLCICDSHNVQQLHNYTKAIVKWSLASQRPYPQEQAQTLL